MKALIAVLLAVASMPITTTVTSAQVQATPGCPHGKWSCPAPGQRYRGETPFWTCSNGELEFCINVNTIHYDKDHDGVKVMTDAVAEDYWGNKIGTEHLEIWVECDDLIWGYVQDRSGDSVPFKQKSLLGKVCEVGRSGNY